MNDSHSNIPAPDEKLYTPGEVAALLRVSSKTPSRWALSGKVDSIRTPGGHRRFRESVVLALLNGGQS